MKKLFILLLILVAAGYCLVKFKIVSFDEKTGEIKIRVPEIAWDDDSVIPTIKNVSCDVSARMFPCRDYETGLVWSDISEKPMDWNAAKQYCAGLKEGNENDWRLPDIDELRTLLKSGNAATDGTCKVSAKNKCLDSNCWSMETCFEDACRVSEEKCFFKDGRYSKLEDGRNNNVW